MHEEAGKNHWRLTNFSNSVKNVRLRGGKRCPGQRQQRPRVRKEEEEVEDKDRRKETREERSPEQEAASRLCAAVGESRAGNERTAEEDDDGGEDGTQQVQAHQPVVPLSSVLSLSLLPDNERVLPKKYSSFPAKESGRRLRERKHCLPSGSTVALSRRVGVGGRSASFECISHTIICML